MKIYAKMIGKFVLGTAASVLLVFLAGALFSLYVSVFLAGWRIF